MIKEKAVNNNILKEQYSNNIKIAKFKGWFT